MSNVSDLTIEVLKGIRSDLAEIKAEVAGVKAEVSGVKAEVAGVRTELKAEIRELRTELKAEIRAVRTELKGELTELRTEVHELREDMNAGFVATHQRIDAVLQITGVHHTDLEGRVRRIEDHLKLPHAT